MIDRALLLKDLQKLTLSLESDLRARCRENPLVEAPLREDYAAARAAGRTARQWEDWRDDLLTQAAVHWVLGCVFVRFLEDNGLVANPVDATEPPFLSGPGPRRAAALDRRTHYFQGHPAGSDRDYLLDVFRTVAQLPAAKALFDERHNPIWRVGPSGDGVHTLLSMWWQVDPTAGALRHDFTDAGMDTRFLGDLYQDLSKSAKKTYALLQTPIFVEEFILDRTLDPAIQTFGWKEVRLIDMACGSGHFLLGGFARLLGCWLLHEPGLPPAVRAQRALDGVYGVDLNPFAVAIARFRLLVAALHAAEILRLKDAPEFRINLASGDSLLHGKRWQAGTSRHATTGTQTTIEPERDGLQHVYATEDRDDLARILGQQYQVVVGNPPYINVKDKALNQAYRDRYESCHMKYSLAVPFTERFFELAVAADGGSPAGFVGMITSDSFMKREFGSKLIKQFIPKWDLTHVIATSGAYIPGHGTTTVILLGRHQRPVATTVRTVMGIRGEPSTPKDPARGVVWSAIVLQVDEPGSESAYVSVSDRPRADFHTHPWNVGGGGAAELKGLLGEQARKLLGSVASSIGITAFTLEDDIYLLPARAAHRHRIPDRHLREMVVGDAIRDWATAGCDPAVFPYNADFTPITFESQEACLRYLWLARTMIGNNKMFGDKTKIEAGLNWYEYGRLTAHKLQTPLSITFAFVATHNHFALERGGKVFKQSAPIIKLPQSATEDHYLELLGLLNSSTGCFWMKQVFHDKGSTVDQKGARQTTVAFENFREFTSTGLKKFPIPRVKPLVLAKRLDALGMARLRMPSITTLPTASSLQWDREAHAENLAESIALQEELDWECYRLYSLLSDDLTMAGGKVPGIQLGQRAFEIAMARKVESGELETTWFERHGSKPTTEIPGHWPEVYRQLVARRLEVIEANANIRLIEQPEFKRRWNTEPWERQQNRALREWLLKRLETSGYWPGIEPQSCAHLADTAQRDSAFMQVAELYRGRADFDVNALVTELVVPESVPYLPSLRYTESGRAKHLRWQRTWHRQREEDATDRRTGLSQTDPLYLTVSEAAARKAAEIGDAPIPPKYAAGDFQSGDYWRLRGKLDVPKERFILYLHAERAGDPTPVIGWAGWDYLQQARALAAYYVAMKEKDGWPTERLTPLLSGLLELLPWLRQWHNELDPGIGMGLGDYFAGFVEEEMRALGLTAQEVSSWAPPTRTRRARARRGAATEE